MAIDENPKQEIHTTASASDSGQDTKFVAIFVILAVLAVGDVYTLSRISSTRTSLEAQQAQLRTDLSTQFVQQTSASLSDMQRSNAQQIDAIRAEIGAATKTVKSTNAQVRKAKTMLTDLQNEQKEQVETVQQQLAQKADAQQLIPISEQVSSTRSDLDGTKKSVDTLRSDLGMARSELGTLIARNHDDIDTLRKLGERNYYEFTLTRKKPEHVANLELSLKKTNVKNHRYNLVVTADEVSVEKKDRTINEPIFLYVKGSKKPSEIVINSVQSGQVKGYVSTPKGTTEVAEAPTTGK
jgi:flagellar biosynthesis chaperone FliJ